MPEAQLEDSGSGLAPVSEGCFVVNVRNAEWRSSRGGALLATSRATLVRSLMRDHLLDELRLFVHPVVVGSGIRLFVSESDPAELELTDSPACDTVSSHSPTGRRRAD